MLLWTLNGAISFDVSTLNVIRLFSFNSNCRLQVCIIRPADKEIQLTAQTSKGTWDDYFSTLMALHIPYPYVFLFISHFLDGTENWNENLASPSIRGSLVFHFFSQTGWLKCIWGAMSKPDSIWDAGKAMWSYVRIVCDVVYIYHAYAHMCLYVCI